MARSSPHAGGSDAGDLPADAVAHPPRDDAPGHGIAADPLAELAQAYADSPELSRAAEELRPTKKSPEPSAGPRPRSAFAARLSTQHKVIAGAAAAGLVLATGVGLAITSITTDSDESGTAQPTSQRPEEAPSGIQGSTASPDTGGVSTALPQDPQENTVKDPRPAPETTYTVEEFDQWLTEEFPTFAPVVYTGNATKDIKLPEGVHTGIITVEALPYDGYGGSVNVITLDERNIGTKEFAGSVGSSESITFGWGLTGDFFTTGLRLSTVSADWKVTVQPVTAAKPLPRTGFDSGVYRYAGDGGPMTVKSSSATRFHAVQYSANTPSTDFDVRTPNGPSGTTTFEASPGPSLIAIVTDGNWKFSE